MDGKLKISLDKRVDSYGKTFYIGKIESPITIDCEKGIAFLVFISDESEEELQICNLEKSNKPKEPKVYTIKKKIQ